MGDASEATFDPTKVRDERERYWMALGRFVHAFSKVERTLQITLWIVAEVGPDAAKVMFPRSQIEEARTKIPRLLEAKGVATPPSLKRAPII